MAQCCFWSGVYDDGDDVDGDDDALQVMLNNLRSCWICLKSHSSYCQKSGLSMVSVMARSLPPVMATRSV